MNNFTNNMRQILETIKSSRKSSIGSIQNTYTPQFNVKRIDSLFEKYFGEALEQTAIANETAVYEIDVTKKYILSFEEHFSMEFTVRLKNQIEAWLKSDFPFLVLSGCSVKLVKVEEVPEDE